MTRRPEDMDYRPLLERAYLELRRMRAELEASERAEGEPIAIVGMGCRLPKVKNLSAFWRFLCEGGDAITHVPAHRWDTAGLLDSDTTAGGDARNRWGGFLEDLDSFDAAFFGISSREAPHVDPRQRLALEVAWEALEDAGVAPASLAGSATGVYIATLTNDYHSILAGDYTLHEAFTGAGTANSIVANRLSYFLDLRGPSLSLDTACSGSLLAIEFACQSLRRGEATLAIAGGVSVNLLPGGEVFFAQAGALSPRGRCQAFDRDADGIVRSEGVGFVVLKPLAAALGGGDRIYALIRGGAVNHNGRSNGIMAPNGLAQEALLRDAYRRAGVSPGAVQYVEAHGTGTRLGDPIEADALAAVLSAERAPGRPCALGSVKTNVGHLEAAAGVVGVIKTALSLYRRVLPPSIHFKELNPLIRAADFPLRVQQKLDRWPVEDESLVAGVSSFGFGGTNVHIVMEEPPRDVDGRDVASTDDAVTQDVQPADVASRRVEPAYVLPLSAASAEALRATVENIRRFLTDGGDDDARSLRDVCYTASVRRAAHDHRLAVTGRTREEIIDGLEAFLRGERTPAAAHGLATQPAMKELVYVFSGQGTHRRGMGRELIEQEPVFRETIEECERLLSRYVNWSLTEQLAAGEASSRLSETDVAQPAVFAVQVALAALWRSWGVQPAAVVGQSLGEVAAAHVAGALSLEDAISVVFYRSRLMKRMAGQGRTAVVGLSLQQAQQALADFDGRLAVAGSISQTSSVIAGETSALEHLLGALAARDVFCHLLENDGLAFHSPQMNGIKSELTEALSGISPRPASVPFVSTVTGDALEGGMLDAIYWGRNLREPFCFADALKNLIDEGHRCFLEVSPHPALAGAIRQALLQQEHEGLALPSLMRDRGEKSSMLASLAALYAQGHAVEWRALYPAGGRCVSLPPYPWQRERYWYDQLKSRRATGNRATRNHAAGNHATGDALSVARTRARTHPLLGENFKSALATGEQFWEVVLDAGSPAYLSDHRVEEAIVFPGAGYLEMALAAARELQQGATLTIENVAFERALVLSETDAFKLQFAYTPAADGEASFEIYSTGASDANETPRWTLHASGRIPHPSPDNKTSAPTSVALRELEARCPRPLSPAEHYRAMRARQLHYGDAFRAIESIRRGDGEALSRCVLPERLLPEIESYHVHPVLLDAGFQAVASALPDAFDALYLPQGVERVRVRRRLADRAWCHARLRPDAQPGAQTLKADVRFFADDGEVAIEVEGLSLRRFDAAQQVKTAAPEDFLYELHWQPQPLDIDHPARPDDAPATYLVFTDGSDIAERFAAHVEARSHACVKVYAAEHYRIDADARTCYVNPRDPEQFGRLLHDALTADLPDCRAVVHLWGLDASRAEATTCAELAEAQTRGCEALLHIVQALTTANACGDARLRVVTNRAQSVGGESADLTFAQSAMWGLGRVVAVEHAEVWGGLIDVDVCEGGDATAEMLFEEISRGTGETEVAYRAGQRYVARLKRLRIPPSRAAYQFRVDASYLITGGLSGLGLETARWMVRRGARRLVLLARTPLPERGAWSELAGGTPEAERVAAVLELERMGASVHVFAADVGDEAQLPAALERFRREGWPRVRGVVHSAGVIQDQLLMRMETCALREVMKPKLYGSWLLHKLTEREELDFFIMFSSATSLLGNTGQANYAAANASMDALAHYRRRKGLPALSINWGPWAEAGLYARANLAARDASGAVEGIMTEEGAEVLSLLVGSELTQALVLHADWTKMRAQPLLSELVSERRATAVAASETRRAGETFVLEMLLADEAERRAMLEEYLTNAVGRVFRCEAQGVSRSSVLANLGMDSIMAVELKNSIAADLNLNVSLAELFTGSVSHLVEKLDAQLRDDERLAKALADIEELSMDEVLSQLAAETPEEQSGATDAG